MKKCTKCLKEKVLEEFYFWSGRYTPRCKECKRWVDIHGRDKERRKAQQNSDKAKRQRKNQKLLKRYGITLEQYEIMFQLQNGVCKICKKDQGYKSLAVDHDHLTGKVRSLLCENCNMAIGAAKEDIEILKEMIRYLGGEI